MRSSSAAIVAPALLVALAFASGCVSEQRREMLEAREAHRACVENHPRDADRACAELKAEAQAREERYEDDAQQAWGCGGVTGPCDPTDRAPRIP